MSLNSRILELQRKHQSLEQEVALAQRSPAADTLRIADLKKQKLRLKEEIAGLSA